MPTDVIQHLRRAVFLRDQAGLTDGQLLDRFVEHRDEDAFAALVRRHGPMVWGVCRRVLANGQDAEDAFQATFLVLVRKAASVAPREMVGNWLYGVAHHASLKARRTAVRRREKQVALPERAVTDPDSCDDLRPLLDQELSRLPDKYRVVVVLCDLEAKTRTEAARQLGWPEGTVAGRLARAREMLARRLARRGVTLSGVASAGVPGIVVSSTIQAATSGAGATSASVAVLIQGVLNAMFVTKLKTAVVVLAMLGAATLTCGMLAGTGEGPDKSTATGKKTQKVDAKASDAAILDRLKKQGLKGSDAADDITFIRRLYLDILGFPPAPRVVEDFVKDKDADKRTKLKLRLTTRPAPGNYTGAGQVMAIDAKGVITYPDSPGPVICHIELLEDGGLKAEFPDKELGRGKWHTVTMKLSAKEPFTVWTATMKGDTYKVTSMPYSPEAHIFRLEILTDGKLVAGAQQFFAIREVRPEKKRGVGQ